MSDVVGELGRGDALPPGPYSVGLTHGMREDGPPWTVQCGDGRAVSGHVPSREIAVAIVEALNLLYPVDNGRRRDHNR
jgi:hypothetical protein